VSRARGIRSPDLAAACGLAVVGLLVSMASLGGWLQAVVLAPLVLAVPGYAIAAALFPPWTIERADRVIYSFVFSIGAAALGGLALQTVVDPDRGAWLALLALITFGASAVAQSRRAVSPIQHAPGQSSRLPAGPHWAVAFLAALAIAGGAIAIAAGGVHEQQSHRRFASLWAVPVPGGGGTVEAGVWNHGGPASYTLEVRSGGTTIEKLRLRLSPSQQWRATLGPEVSSRGPALLLALYHDSTPYRSVELNIEEP